MKINEGSVAKMEVPTFDRFLTIFRSELSLAGMADQQIDFVVGEVKSDLASRVTGCTGELSTQAHQAIAVAIRAVASNAQFIGVSAKTAALRQIVRAHFVGLGKNLNPGCTDNATLFELVGDSVADNLDGSSLMNNDLIRSAESIGAGAIDGLVRADLTIGDLTTAVNAFSKGLVAAIKENSNYDGLEAQLVGSLLSGQYEAIKSQVDLSPEESEILLAGSLTLAREILGSISGSPLLRITASPSVRAGQDVEVIVELNHALQGDLSLVFYAKDISAVYGTDFQIDPMRSYPMVINFPAGMTGARMFKFTTANTAAVVDKYFILQPGIAGYTGRDNPELVENRMLQGTENLLVRIEGSSATALPHGSPIADFSFQDDAIRTIIPGGGGGGVIDIKQSGGVPNTQYYLSVKTEVTNTNLSTIPTNLRSYLSMASVMTCKKDSENRLCALTLEASDPSLLPSGKFIEFRVTLTSVMGAKATIGGDGPKTFVIRLER